MEKSKVLIVDDRAENLLAMKKTLEEIDAELFTAQSGQEALRITLHHSFALIILDVEMPEMDGYELAELLRGKKETRLVPIMFLSAVYSSGYSLFKGYQTGAVDFLVKPVPPEIIFNKVKVFVTLDRQKNQAREADALKSRFLANMSHEIRTPMSVIIGFTELMLFDEMDPQHKDYLEAIHSSGLLLLHLINDILDVSKIEANQLVIESNSFDLEELIENTTGGAQMYMNNLGKSLEFKIYTSPDISKYIITDKYRLHQILNNLLSNAIKFTEEGCIQLNISLSENNLLEFSVKDSGIGIPEDKLTVVFNAFSQLDEIKNVPGTGLGLAITRKLINLLGGEISLQSEVSVGSTFTFTIPYQPVEFLLKPEESDIKATNKNILLVEDDEISLELLRLFIEHSGYSFITAANGEQAVAEYEKNSSIGLIIMDVEMPVMDGYEAVKMIRKVENNGTHVPVIALTAYAMSSDKEKCLEAGFTDYLSKPIEHRTLLEMIEKY